MVYKLVQINGIAKIKLSDEREKTTLPGEKQILRIYTQDEKGHLKPSLDVLCLIDETDELLKKFNESTPGTEPLELFEAFGDNKASVVYPFKVETLSNLLLDGGKET
jgi:nicotinate phosphoribosyltransferase